MRKNKEITLKKLFKKGSYANENNTYAKEEYKLSSNGIDEKDIIEEENNKSKTNKKSLFKKWLKFLTCIVASAVLVISGLFKIAQYGEYKEDKEKYKNELDDYDKKVNEYAEEVNKLDLTDIQIFVKVMSDMWNSIRGYGNPVIDSPTFPRLDLKDETSVGVCRNMADDVAYKLNAINKDYNARVVHVYMNDKGPNVCDIRRIKVQTTNNQEASSKPALDLTGALGNHAVTAVDIKEKNITLILDPTNPSISVYKNGNIYTFNSTEEIFEYKMMGDFVLGFNTVENVKTVFESFIPNKYDVKELNLEYGLEAENRALEELREQNLLKIGNVSIYNIDYLKMIIENNSEVEKFSKIKRKI